MPDGSAFLVPAERMAAEGKLCERMIVTLKTDRGRVAYIADDADAWQGFAYAESLAGEDFLVALCMKLGESLAELEFVAVDIQGTVGPLLALYGILGEVVSIDAEEIADTGLFEFEVTGHAVKAHDMDDILLYRTENPLKHIVEMHADVCCDTAALVHITFP